MDHDGRDSWKEEMRYGMVGMENGAAGRGRELERELVGERWMDAGS